MIIISWKFNKWHGLIFETYRFFSGEKKSDLSETEDKGAATHSKKKRSVEVNNSVDTDDAADEDKVEHSPKSGVDMESENSDAEVGDSQMPTADDSPAPQTVREDNADAEVGTESESEAREAEDQTKVDSDGEKDETVDRKSGMQGPRISSGEAAAEDFKSEDVKESAKKKVQMPGTSEMKDEEAFEDEEDLQDEEEAEPGIEECEASPTSKADQSQEDRPDSDCEESTRVKRRKSPSEQVGDEVGEDSRANEQSKIKSARITAVEDQESVELNSEEIDTDTKMEESGGQVQRPCKDIHHKQASDVEEESTEHSKTHGKESSSAIDELSTKTEARQSQAKMENDDEQDRSSEKSEEEGDSTGKKSKSARKSDDGSESVSKVDESKSQRGKYDSCDSGAITKEGGATSKLADKEVSGKRDSDVDGDGDEEKKTEESGQAKEEEDAQADGDADGGHASDASDADGEASGGVGGDDNGGGGSSAGAGGSTPVASVGSGRPVPRVGHRYLCLIIWCDSLGFAR
jgi:hypothetical protein